jgi:hypothetical protein
MQTDPQAAFIESAQALKARIATPRVEALPQPRGPAADAERRRRALNTCHRYAPAERLPRKAAPRASRAYVPELAARIEDDPNLSDGARRCARKLAELTYRQNREGRSLPVTVTYLAKALDRCRRTVQRYLRQLEREGYVSVDVVISQRARMCVGLVVRLLEPLLAAHHRGKWPGALAKPGATRESQNKRFRLFPIGNGMPIPVEQWALRCMDGVFRAFMETKPLVGLPGVAPH